MEASRTRSRLYHALFTTPLCVPYVHVELINRLEHRPQGGTRQSKKISTNSPPHQCSFVAQRTSDSGTELLHRHCGLQRHSKQNLQGRGRAQRVGRSRQEFLAECFRHGAGLTKVAWRASLGGSWSAVLRRRRGVPDVVEGEMTLSALITTWPPECCPVA